MCAASSEDVQQFLVCAHRVPSPWPREIARHLELHAMANPVGLVVAIAIRMEALFTTET